MQTLTSYLRSTAGRCLTPLAMRAATSYIAGPELNDALRVADMLARKGFATTLGFWDGPGDSPADVASHYLAALDAVAHGAANSYLSMKLPALGESRELLDKVLDKARTNRQRIHFDSLAPEAADAMWSAAIEAAADAEISCSLPGRWRRSLHDADRAVAAGIIPRVVKGQWADPQDQEADMRQGFLSLVERLAGRASHVAIASHDAPLAGEAMRRLRTAGTSCELELLYGLPQRASLAAAQREAVSVRFYVPYGKAYLPYCLGQVRRQPRLLWWLVRDALLRGGCSHVSEPQRSEVFAQFRGDGRLERIGTVSGSDCS